MTPEPREGSYTTIEQTATELRRAGTRLFSEGGRSDIRSPGSYGAKRFMEARLQWATVERRAAEFFGSGTQSKQENPDSLRESLRELVRAVEKLGRAIEVEQGDITLPARSNVAQQKLLILTQQLKERHGLEDF